MDPTSYIESPAKVGVITEVKGLSLREGSATREGASLRRGPSLLRNGLLQSEGGIIVKGGLCAKEGSSPQRPRNQHRGRDGMPPREGASLRQDFYQRRENGCHLSMSLAMGGSITNRGKASCCESDCSCLPRVGLPLREGASDYCQGWDCL